MKKKVKVITGTRTTWRGEFLTDDMTIVCGDTTVATGNLACRLHKEFEATHQMTYDIGYIDGVAAGRIKELTRSNKLLQAVSVLFDTDATISREEAIQMLGVLKQEIKRECN